MFDSFSEGTVFYGRAAVVVVAVIAVAVVLQLL